MCDPKRIAAGAHREDVAGRIDSRLQAGGLHQAHHVASSRDVGVRVGDAAYPVGERAARGAAEHAQRFDAFAQPASVDASNRLRATADAGGRSDRRRREPAHERSPRDHGCSPRAGRPIRSSFVRS
jgi:hypothetical protein